MSLTGRSQSLIRRVPPTPWAVTSKSFLLAKRVVTCLAGAEEIAACRFRGVEIAGASGRGEPLRCGGQTRRPLLEKGRLLPDCGQRLGLHSGLRTGARREPGRELLGERLDYFRIRLHRRKVRLRA